MKVIFATSVFPPEIGGPSTYVSEVSRLLYKKNINIEIVSYTHGAKKGYVCTGPLKIFCMFLKILLSDADVVYAQDPLAVGLPCLIASKLSGKKFIVRFVGERCWERDSFRGKIGIPLEEYLSSNKGGILRIIESLVLKNAVVVTPSYYLKKILKKYFKVNSVLIYNFVDVKRKGFRKDNSIIFVGRLIPIKGIPTIIEAVKRCGLKLKVVGSGPLEDEIKKHPNIIFLGPQTRERTLDEIEKSNLLVLNSLQEGLPHVAIEALSLGTGVIASNKGGNPEVVDKSCLFEYNNVDEMARLINKYIKDYKKCWKKSLPKIRKMTAKNHILRLTKILSI